MNSDGNLVSILVPENSVLDIYAFLSQRMPKLGKLEIDDPPSERPHGSDEWPDDLLQRAYQESAKPMRGILRYLAEKAGETVKARELICLLGEIRQIDANFNTLAGTLGAFGNRVSQRYKRKDWPFFSWWVDDERQVNYKMGERTAKIILESNGSQAH